MTKTELSDHFNRHVSADQLNEALNALVESGEVVMDKDTDTGGRPAERYRVAAKKAK
jgi:predicted ArsR family transcriptional regulator